MLGIERGHAAGARRGDGLPVNGIGHVPGREHARQAGRRGLARGPAPGHDIAALHLKLAGEDLRVGLMPNRDKDALEVKPGDGAILCVLDIYPVDAAGVAQHLGQV